MSTPEKFIVQLSAVVIRQDGLAQNMFVYVARSAFVERGGSLSTNILHGRGASPTNYCWCQKTRVIAVSCGIIISTVRHLVLSQYTHLTDRQQTDGQNCNSNTVHCIICSRTVINVAV